MLKIFFNRQKYLGKTEPQLRLDSTSSGGACVEVELAIVEVRYWLSLLRACALHLLTSPLPRQFAGRSVFLCRVPLLCHSPVRVVVLMCHTPATRILTPVHYPYDGNMDRLFGFVSRLVAPSSLSA